MKKIGLLGGMSWESSLEYYRLLNQAVRDELGDLHSAHCVLYSVDFAPFEQWQRNGCWEEIGEELSKAALCLERAGADFLVLCTNTMHVVSETVTNHVSIPLLHIGDVTAKEIARAGLRTVGLLGTRFTMEQTFYRARLEQHGFNILVPDEAGRELVHSVIYDELCTGKVLDRSLASFREVITQLELKGAEGVVLGCTEIGLLVKQEHVEIPLFDTTSIHARAAIRLALGP
jgi:aspartate racemase